MRLSLVSHTPPTSRALRKRGCEAPVVPGAFVGGERERFGECVGSVVGTGDVGVVDLVGVYQVAKVMCLAIEGLAAAGVSEVLHVGGGRLVVAVELYGLVGVLTHRFE